MACGASSLKLDELMSLAAPEAQLCEQALRGGGRGRPAADDVRFDGRRGARRRAGSFGKAPLEPVDDERPHPGALLLGAQRRSSPVDASAVRCSSTMAHSVLESRAGQSGDGDCAWQPARALSRKVAEGGVQVAQSRPRAMRRRPRRPC